MDGLDAAPNVAHEPHVAVQRASSRYFLPEDWVLEHQHEELVATKLSTGEVVRITGKAADDIVARASNAATWNTMARHEPLVGELHDQLQAHALAPLDRCSLLRGAGWRQLFIELTARCNERCVHCYAGSSPERPEQLEWPEIRRVLDDARELGFAVVQLTGGDPLVSPYCVRAAEYAREIGIEGLEVYTNGLALRGKTYDRLRELNVSFAFSFYSHDPARHDAITQTPGSHERTSRAIRQAASDGLRVRAGSIVMDENMGDATGTYHYLVQLGVPSDAIGFDQARKVGRGTLPVIQESGAVHAGSYAMGASGSYGGSTYGSVEQAHKRHFGGSAAVSYDGIVYPCIFSRHLPLGSIRDGSLSDILSAPEPVAEVPETFLQERDAWSAKLSCWECQTRSIMLGAQCDG